MLNKIIVFSVGHKFIIGLFVIGLLGLGVYETTKLPIDAVPDITNNQVQVITVAPSFGATDIERLITFPIEQANSNISGMTEIRSFSRFGLSLVSIVFEDEVDIYWARQQVAERLQQVQAQIPSRIGQPELGPISTGLGEIYQYVVRPKEGYESKFDETELRTIQDWIVRRQLLGVKGVAEVSSFGGKLKQYEIAVNPQKLKSYNLTIQDVFTALEKNNENTGGAYIEKGETVLFIRSEGLVGSLEDIGNIPIPINNGESSLFMRDVATIQFGHATRYGAMCFNDKGEVAGAVVMMLKGANSGEVIKNVKERVAQIQKSLPEGVVIEPFLDRSKMVNNAIGTVETNLMEGALIVVFILVLFLGNFRAGILVASVIPLSLLFAIIMMNIFGVSGNLMSLGALDFGLIVDGSVIIVEAVMHQLTHSKKYQSANLISQQEMDYQVNQSASKMMNSAVFGQIIILIVYLPIFTLQGIEGKMFKPMAQTVAFALLGAFILSLTYVPMMSAWFLSKKIKHKPNFSDRVMERVEQGYQRMLRAVLHHPKIVIGTVLILFCSSIYVVTGLGGEFIPALEEGDFAVETRVLTGSNLNTTIESTQKAAHILKTRFPEVEKVVTKIGSGEIPTDPMPMEASDLMVILKDKKEWTSAKTFDELSEKMTKELSDVPEITVGFQFPVQMRFNELMTGARQDVVCKIFGENLDTLAHYADRLGKLVNQVDGTLGLYVEPVTGMPQIQIEFNRAMIAQYNLSVAEINQVINTAFAGQSTGLVFEGEKRFDMVVRLQTDQRENLEDVQNLLIPTPNGTQIPLYQLAKVEIKDGPNQIQREDAKRRIVVGFNIKDRDVQSIVSDLQAKVEKEIKLPAGYYVTYGGAFENLQAATQRLMIAVPVSLVLIFILLFFAFNSVKQGLLIYSAIPLSAIGGIFALYVRGMPFSISAGVGFIALFGVAVLNGIVLIAEFNRLKSNGDVNIYRIVLNGTKMRLRPVLMTAFVASLGFLPMALSNGSGAEVQRPLASVVIGGLLIATFLTLFVLPILYILFESKHSKKLPKVAPLLVLGLFFSFNALAQTPISLTAAIDTALKNNMQLKNEKLKAAYQQELIKTAWSIPQTTVSMEAGQINSIFNDQRYGISQSLQFPTVYSRQKKVNEANWEAAVLGVNLKTLEVKKLVSELYAQWILLLQKERLLVQADSLYTLFIEKSVNRLKAGESNVLEKISAESQRGSIHVQRIALQQEIARIKLQFQLVLNAETNFIPESNSWKLQPIGSNSEVENHPLLQMYKQDLKRTEAATKYQKSLLLPEINLGYYNMSMLGTGADNQFYNSDKRFASAQVGIGIPLFFGSQKAQIEAAKVQQKWAQSEMETQKQAFENQLKSALLRQENQQAVVNYFEEIALPNARLIRQTAQQQFQEGSIDYLDWVVLINQATSIELNHLDAVKLLNDCTLEIYYLTSNL